MMPTQVLDCFIKAAASDVVLYKKVLVHLSVHKIVYNPVTYCSSAIMYTRRSTCHIGVAMTDLVR